MTAVITLVLLAAPFALIGALVWLLTVVIGRETGRSGK
jgi:hypothetical protein